MTINTTVQPNDEITILTKPDTDHTMALVRHTNGTWFSAKCPTDTDTYEVVRTGRAPRGSAWNGTGELARLKPAGWK